MSRVQATSRSSCPVSSRLPRLVWRAKRRRFWWERGARSHSARNRCCRRFRRR